MSKLNASATSKVPNRILNSGLIRMASKLVRVYFQPSKHHILTIEYAVDSLDLVLDADADGRIGSNWSKAQVFETLGSIYRRIDNFLETTRHQGYTSPFAKWDIILQKRDKEEMMSSGKVISQSINTSAPTDVIPISYRVVGDS